MILLLVAATLLAGCGNAAEPASTDNNKKLKIVSTIYPQHDWVCQILGERAADAELTLLVDQGVDLHSFQPTVADIATISSCDLFIYVGGESDAWVEEALANAVNEDMVVINLLEVLGDKVKTEEAIEGMEHNHQDEAAHDHDEDAGHDHEDEGHNHESEPHSEEGALDEHVWLSLTNADALCSYLTEQLCVLDPPHASTYQENFRTYHEELLNLKASYDTVVSNATYDTLIFGDRFPFRYLLDDLELTYYAAFDGCSSETEASFETIVFLSEKLDELGLPAILITESSDDALAKTIVNNTPQKDQDILVLNSLQSTGISDSGENISYLSLMENNLTVLEQALNPQPGTDD